MGREALLFVVVVVVVVERYTTAAVREKGGMRTEYRIGKAGIWKTLTEITKVVIVQKRANL